MEFGAVFSFSLLEADIDFVYCLFPHGQVPLDSTNAIVQGKQSTVGIEYFLSQLPSKKSAGIRKLLNDGDGFEAGFRLGKALLEGSAPKVLQKPLLAV